MNNVFVDVQLSKLKLAVRLKLPYLPEIDLPPIDCCNGMIPECPVPVGSLVQYNEAGDVDMNLPEGLFQVIHYFLILAWKFINGEETRYGAV